jgi:hypothetical protein
MTEGFSMLIVPALVVLAMILVIIAMSMER